MTTWCGHCLAQIALKFLGDQWIQNVQWQSHSLTGKVSFITTGSSMELLLALNTGAPCWNSETRSEPKGHTCGGAGECFPFSSMMTTPPHILALTPGDSRWWATSRRWSIPLIHQISVCVIFSYFPPSNAFSEDRPSPQCRTSSRRSIISWDKCLHGAGSAASGSGSGGCCAALTLMAITSRGCGTLRPCHDHRSNWHNLYRILINSFELALICSVDICSQLPRNCVNSLRTTRPSLKHDSDTNFLGTPRKTTRMLWSEDERFDSVKCDSLAPRKKMMELEMFKSLWLRPLRRKT